MNRREFLALFGQSAIGTALAAALPKNVSAEPGVPSRGNHAEELMRLLDDDSDKMRAVFFDPRTNTLIEAIVSEATLRCEIGACRSINSDGTISFKLPPDLGSISIEGRAICMTRITE